ncbi:MAG TPA: cysteine--tRNA ligase [Solirubrobacterales bacterium]|nr:cysteine--tRNA ligase [Solirubrobacterales bacterium]
MSGELLTLGTDEEIGIYACGPTVYSRIHIGNARPFVIFSLLARFLRSEGYGAKLAINVTDVNDKIYTAAAGRGVSSTELAAEMTAAYFEDTGRLGIGRPDSEPLATETIGPIIDLIATLVEEGHAYESGGDVYFAVRSFDGYGKLSHRPTEEMEQGEGDDAGSLKRDPLDFALWKAKKDGEDLSWESPWGPGRPGWHIECSAMAEAELGQPFTIHGGGSDLVFPHHENEIAQSEAARGEQLARIWMHNGMIETGSEKMSKSVGNIFQLSEALDAYGAETVVAYLISGHYRQPLAFGEGPLEQAAAGNERLRNFLRENPPAGAGEGVPGDEAAAAGSRFRDALADDFNTPRAMREAFDLVRAVNQRPDDPALAGAGTVLAGMLELVGLESLATGGEEGPGDEALELLEARNAARADKDWARADEIRDSLAELGWEVRDGAEGARLVPRS